MPSFPPETAIPRPSFTGRSANRAARFAFAVAAAGLFALWPSVGRCGFAEEHDRATRALLCDCGCSPQSVHDCACGRAAGMRDEIAAQIRGGMTGQQVIDEAVKRGGEKVLIAPTATGFNLLAWLGPGAALLLGIAGVVIILRRWRPSTPVSPATVPSLPSADDPYLARLERELKERE